MPAAKETHIFLSFPDNCQYLKGVVYFVSKSIQSSAIRMDKL